MTNGGSMNGPGEERFAGSYGSVMAGGKEGGVSIDALDKALNQR